MREKVKEFCYRELKHCKEWGMDPQQALTRCYGAVMFVLSVEPDENEPDGLGWWWNNEMHPCFRELGAN